MPRNEDGEYELVLGNRQLLSVFFIVVVLLGVGFTMGYILGKNAAPGMSAIKNAPSTAILPMVVDSPRADPAPRAAVEERLEKLKAATATGDGSLHKGTPSKGMTFVQVLASTREDAEMTGRQLQKHELPVWIAPGDSDGRFRVLVGPIPDAADLARAKAKIESLGFKTPFKKVY